MKPYTKVYMHYFGYTIADFMPCEIPGCNRRAVDVAHIWAKSIRDDLRNEIKNLMGTCREHHDEYGDKVEKREWLQQVHNTFMETNGVNPEPMIIKKQPKKREKLYNTFNRNL